MVKNFFSGNINDAIDMQIKAIPLINSLFSEVNPIPIKESLNIIGFDFGEPRLPLVKMSENKKKDLEKLLEIFWFLQNNIGDPYTLSLILKRLPYCIWIYYFIML